MRDLTLKNPKSAYVIITLVKLSDFNSYFIFV